MDWSVALGGSFASRMMEVFSGTLNNFLGVDPDEPFVSAANGVLPFVILVAGLMFAQQVIRMIHRITSDQGVSSKSNSGGSEGGFRNE